MAREIKFRIWDATPIKDGLSGLMIDMNYAISSSYLTDAINGKYPIMQYIGLKDKKGKEIYECDVLKLYFPKASEGSRECDVNFVVSYYVDGFKVSGQKTIKNYLNQVIINTPKSLNYKDWVHTTVIGNIYQNPELLK